jgi:hypothetical protein
LSAKEAIVIALRDSSRFEDIARRDLVAAGVFVRGGASGTTRFVERAGHTCRN